MIAVYLLIGLFGAATRQPWAWWLVLGVVAALGRPRAAP